MRKGDREKRDYWARVIREAARSGLSIREYCRRRRVKESRFYWWQRKLREGKAKRRRDDATSGGEATFALVSEETDFRDAGVELVLSDGRRLRIGRGVDEGTLRAVLAALEPERC